MFKVGDKIVALKERPASYNVTTDKVVCEVIEVLNGGFLVVEVVGDTGFDYTVDPRYFKHLPPPFKGNK